MAVNNSFQSRITQFKRQAGATSISNGAYVTLLQARNIQALSELRRLRSVNLPGQRQIQLERLIETTQTYSMFLEDLQGQSNPVDTAAVKEMLTLIDEHCQLVDSITTKAFGADRDSV